MKPKPNINRPEVCYFQIANGVMPLGYCARGSQVKALEAYTDQLEKEFDKLYTEHLATVSESLKRRARSVE